ncbi:MAG: hypothetical protein ACREMY_18400, partial [bacterium]
RKPLSGLATEHGGLVDTTALEAPEAEGDIAGDVAFVPSFRRPALHDLALELLPLLDGLQTGYHDRVGREDGVFDGVAGDALFVTSSLGAALLFGRIAMRPYKIRRAFGRIAMRPYQIRRARGGG